MAHPHGPAYPAIRVKGIRDCNRAVSQTSARCVDSVVGAEHRPKLFASHRNHTSERPPRSHPELHLVAQTNAGALGEGHVNLLIVERIAAGG
jgi:hypothetical protein